MQRILWLLFIFVGCVSVAFAGSKYNSRTGTKDFCVTIQTQDGTVQNTDCTTVKLPNNTFFSHTDTATSAVDYYFSTGINWDYVEVPGNSINWTDVQRDIPTDAINWTTTENYVPGDAINWTDVRNDIPTDAINWSDADKDIPTTGINWEDITGITSNKAICINTSGRISYCTSTVGAPGTCTCQ